MSEFSATIQNADWKVEKHAPVIEAPDSVKAGDFFTVTAGLGKAIAHPNTVQHHISWISLYFLPEGAKLAIQLQSKIKQTLQAGSFVFRGQATAVSALDADLLEAAKKLLSDVAEQVFDRYVEAPVRVATDTAEKFLKVANPAAIRSSTVRSSGSPISRKLSPSSAGTGFSIAGG